MTGVTSRYSLTTLASAGTDNVNVDIDFNNNWNAIDLVLGCQVCTSTTRPSTPVKGQWIFETDTNRTLAYDGTTWQLPQGRTLLATSSTLPTGVNLFSGQLAYESDMKNVVVYSGSTWYPLAYSMYVCTSSTRPSTPFQGMEIYETDTNVSRVYSGSSWLAQATQVAPTVTLGSAAASVTFSSIPAYNHLSLLWHARSASGSTDTLIAQINSDSNVAHYQMEGLDAKNTTVSSLSSTARAGMSLGGVPISSSTVNYFAGGRTEFQGWADSTNFLTSSTTFHSPLGVYGTTSNCWAGHQWANFLVAGSYNSIKIALTSGSNILAGSSFSLYGYM